MLTALSFISTRIHDFMKATKYKEHNRKTASSWPNAPFLNPLRNLAGPTKQVVGACFFSAALQITLGLWDNRIAEMVCLLIPIMTLTAVTHVAITSIQIYEQWLNQSEADVQEEARDRQAS